MKISAILLIFFVASMVEERFANSIEYIQHDAVQSVYHISMNLIIWLQNV